MLARIAGPRARLEFAVGLEAAYHPSSLLSRRAADGNQFCSLGNMFILCFRVGLRSAVDGGSFTS